MSENCNQDCSSCSENCSEREQESLIEKPHELSNIKKVIGVVSGKGGVGKSLVTSLLSVSMSRKDYHTAILDADITGPSIPKAFGLKDKAVSDNLGLYPVKTSTGIDIMSVNLLLDHDTDPVVWRGPLIAGTVKQFWTDVIWNDVDYMFVDLPPGTGDVPLTVFQTMPLDGIVIVTSPQDLVSMIVNKAVKMAKMMSIPIIGVVENMSYVECPDCHKKISVFGESNVDKVAKENGIEVLAKIPIDTKLANAVDRGAVELYSGDWMENATDTIEKL